MAASEVEVEVSVVGTPPGSELIVAPKWWEVLLKSWSVYVAGLGLVLPELADLVLSNLDSLPLSPEKKMWIRVGALALVIVLRPIPQRSLRKSPETLERKTP